MIYRVCRDIVADGDNPTVLKLRARGVIGDDSRLFQAVSAIRAEMGLSRPPGAHAPRAIVPHRNGTPDVEIDAICLSLLDAGERISREALRARGVVADNDRLWGSIRRCKPAKLEDEIGNQPDPPPWEKAEIEQRIAEARREREAAVLAHDHVDRGNAGHRAYDAEQRIARRGRVDPSVKFMAQDESTGIDNGWYHFRGGERK